MLVRGVVETPRHSAPPLKIDGVMALRYGTVQSYIQKGTYFRYQRSHKAFSFTRAIG